MSHNVSHGRGGAANIRPDDTPYVDGEITREGPVGNQGDGPYSAGRGGAGNIDREPSVSGRAGDEDYVPETAIRPVKDEPQHFGRGGAGNEVKKVNQHGSEKPAHSESIADKIKGVLHGGKKHETKQ
ncbi:hypothetical protein H2198_004670 [Neophaeococcomyces mojaviensis]|uniref:Uncharacterized protein n=1 Tax=Neophaeococcomyces mojaviensis TaxID=3383035 RepID=A0ACC3A809_9EURO|nr:hypothetical protein H2198_004670 [Knufia sp. JES_112]